MQTLSIDDPDEDTVPRGAGRRWAVPVVDPQLQLDNQEIVIYETPVGVVVIPPQCGVCILPAGADEILSRAIQQARQAFDRREMG